MKDLIKKPSTVSQKKISIGDLAAISVAIHLYFNEVHDVESNVITIKRIERRYSPWSSKIFGLNNLYH
jgi:hypothetical protein